MKIAVMGYGTIGSGVVDVLRINKDKITQRAGEPVEVKYILDLRDFPGDPMEELIVHDYKTIANDPEIQKACGDGYDVVAANIIAEILADITPAVPQRLKKGGIYITSGILTTHADIVRKAMADAGLCIIEENILGEWESIIAVKE